MNLLSIFLFAGSAADIDLEKITPDLYRVESFTHVIKSTEKSTSDSTLSPSFYTGVCIAWGYQPLYLVIRSSTKEHASTLADDFANRMNQSSIRFKGLAKGNGEFKSLLLDEDVCNVELHEFIKKHGSETNSKIAFLVPKVMLG